MLACALALQLESPPVNADTMDINAVLYKDANCFERADEMVLLDQGCYANRYANLTKAFQLKIVVFETGIQKIDLREYLNDCYPAYLFRPARTIHCGRCESFVGGFFVQTSLRLRSSTCEGYSCSPLNTAVQSFYSMENCEGLVMENYYYPLQGECMRYNNGSQAFSLPPGYSGKNISQVDFPGNDGCNGVSQRKYSMVDGQCYSLYSEVAPLSFVWQVEKARPLAVSPATRSAPPPGLAWALALGASSLWLAAAVGSAARGNGGGGTGGGP